MSWHERRACKDIEAWHFDDTGTPWAWNACASCPVIAECDQQARAQGQHGVYQAGKAWPETGRTGPQAVARSTADRRARKWLRIRTLHDQGMSLPAIGRAVGMDHSSVLYALRRMGA